MGAKILSLKEPKTVFPKSVRDTKSPLEMTELALISYDSENQDNDRNGNGYGNGNINGNGNLNGFTVQNENERNEHFYLEQTIWCKMSWGRARVYILVRNSTP
jgi:actin-related protein